MRQIVKSIHTLVAFFAMVAAVAQPVDDKENELSNAIQVKTAKIEKSLEVRNFKQAKTELSELMPLIKKDIKAKKKSVHQLEKSELEKETKAQQELLERRIEIQDQLSSLLDGSSAALRAKSENASSLINEYASMLANDLQLLSSNN